MWINILVLRSETLCDNVTHLSVHVTEHEIKQETLPLPECASHRQHHHMLVSDLRSQQNLSQSLRVQCEGVILLTHCDDLNWAWFTPHCSEVLVPVDITDKKILFF